MAASRLWLWFRSHIAGGRRVAEESDGLVGGIGVLNSLERIVGRIHNGSTTANRVTAVGLSVGLSVHSTLHRAEPKA